MEKHLKATKVLTLLFFSLSTTLYHHFLPLQEKRNVANGYLKYWKTVLDNRLLDIVFCSNSLPLAVLDGFNQRSSAIGYC